MRAIWNRGGESADVGAGTPSGCGDFMGLVHRWCRSALPPANGFQAFGLNFFAKRSDLLVIGRSPFQSDGIVQSPANFWKAFSFGDSADARARDVFFWGSQPSTLNSQIR